MKKKKEFTKRMLVAIAPLMGISAVLLARDKAGEFFLLLIGVVIGIFIWRAYSK